MAKLTRTYLLSVILLTIGLTSVSAESIRLVNPVTFTTTETVSRDTMVSIFGPNLTATTATALGGAPLQTTLGGVTLTINGVQAFIVFVSPTHVKAIVAPSTPPGIGTAVLASANGTFSTPINVSADDIPVFSLVDRQN